MKTRHIITALSITVFLLGNMSSYSYSTTLPNANNNGALEISNPSDVLVLVNKENYLPNDYVPRDLRAVYLPSISEKNQLRDVAASALEEMFKDARNEGYILFAHSGYRSYSLQSSIFYGYVKKYGRTTAETFSAPPGMSEHQTGLTMDVSCKATNYTLTKKFGELPEGKWIKESSWKYGFIIRYPEEKTAITKYIYEPWHLRYVGLDVAKTIHKRSITLEEYLESIKWKDVTFGALFHQA